MEDKKLQNYICKNIPRIKLFFATKDHLFFCKECNSYIYVDTILVETFINYGSTVFIIAALY